MKLKIKTNAQDLKIALELAEDSVLSKAKFASTSGQSINDQEIREEEKACDSEAYIYKQFADLDIQFSFNQPKERAKERICEQCKKRFISVEPYENHFKITGKYVTENNPFNSENDENEFN